ncbi:MAG: PD-(D/E)XK nuclease family protein [Candidatus Nanopelagicales bacterium]
MSDLKWSYSSLGLFQQCPRKYYHLRVVKSIKEPETEAILYGKRVHEAAEFYISKDEPLPPPFEQYKPVLDMLKDMKGEKLCEYKMGLTSDLQACGFFDENVWFRGVADLVVINGKTARVIDYKTGKSSQYADTKQLELMALAIFKHFPEVEKVKAGLVFLVCNDFVKADYDKDSSAKTWIKWVQETDRLQAAHDNNVWNAKPNFTCRSYCLVKECEHNGKGHYR